MFAGTFEKACDIKNMPEEDDDDGNMVVDATCISLDLTPIPGAGSVCDIANGIKHGNTLDIISGSVFLVLDVFTLGQAHYVKAAGKAVTKGSKAIAKGTKAISKLAKMVKKGGKILKGVTVNGKVFKSLSLAAKELKAMKATWK